MASMLLVVAELSGSVGRETTGVRAPVALLTPFRWKRATPAGCSPRLVRRASWSVMYEQQPATATVHTGRCAGCWGVAPVMTFMTDTLRETGEGVKQAFEFLLSAQEALDIPRNLVPN